MADPVEVVVRIGDEDVLAGRFWAHRRGRSESATFSYASTYLAHPDSYALDPLLHEGQLQTPIGRAIFGAFSDCAPDRWGRRLINRDERHRVEPEGGTARTFGEIDYLLHVRDDLRQGALRFRDPESGTYLADKQKGIPYLLDLPTLLNAAAHLERDAATAEEVRTLLRYGSSLGGARPKAHVINRDGRIAIAKFPSPNDDWDVMRWEAVSLELAGRSGITVPTWNLHTIDEKAVLIVDRFDRDGEHRIGYVSALTMLEATDGDNATYLDIADVIERECADPTPDLGELWRRIAFSILVSNTDDHLHNHGFLRVSTAGWALSPAFDINPDPHPGPKSLSTAIDRGSSASVEALFDVAELFRLDRDKAEGVLREVAAGTSVWRAVAADHGLDRDAIEQMASAFEHEQAAIARAIPAG